MEKRGKQRYYIRLCTHSPNVYNDQGLANSKPKSHELLPGVPQGCKVKAFELSSTTFSGHKYGAELKVEQLIHKPASIWHAGSACQGLASYSMAQAPQIHFEMPNFSLKFQFFTGQFTKCNTYFCFQLIFKAFHIMKHEI